MKRKIEIIPTLFLDFIAGGDGIHPVDNMLSPPIPGTPPLMQPNLNFIAVGIVGDGQGNNSYGYGGQTSIPLSSNIYLNASYGGNNMNPLSNPGVAIVGSIRL